jgi:hypothetical protein
MSTKKQHVSVTQMELLSACERKWAWAYLQGQKVQGRSQQLGARVHEIGARILRYENYDISELLEIEGHIYSPGKIAHNMIAQLSMRHLDTSNMLIEQSFEWVHNGILFVGTRDLLLVSKHEPVLIDHKTSSNPIKWAKTDNDLSYDIQGIVYAASAFDQIDGLGQYLTFTLNYVCTNYRDCSNQAHPSTTYYKGGMQGLFKDYVLPYAERIVELYDKNPHPLDLLPSPSMACSQFGGCPYRAQCQLTPAQRLEGIIMSEEKMNAAEKMKMRREMAQQAAQTTGNTAPMAAPKAAPSTGSMAPPAKKIAPKTPIKPPVEAPVEMPIEAPIEAPVDVPVETPVEMPFDWTPVEAPVVAPAKRGRKAGVKMGPRKSKAEASPMAGSNPLQNVYLVTVQALQDSYIKYCDVLRENTNPTLYELIEIQNTVWGKTE